DPRSDNQYLSGMLIAAQIGGFTPIAAMIQGYS
ncbi:uncharacterized protein METZ01_LOCUS210720, partial [marine metagenome]